MANIISSSTGGGGAKVMARWLRRKGIGGGGTLNSSNVNVFEENAGRLGNVVLNGVCILQFIVY
jgi:hypothetical protein